MIAAVDALDRLTRARRLIEPVLGMYTDLEWDSAAQEVCSALARLEDMLAWRDEQEQRRD